MHRALFVHLGRIHFSMDFWGPPSSGGLPVVRGLGICHLKGKGLSWLVWFCLCECL